LERDLGEGLSVAHRKKPLRVPRQFPNSALPSNDNDVIFWRESFIGKGNNCQHPQSLESGLQRASTSLYLYIYFNDLRLLLNAARLPGSNWPRFKMSFFKVAPSRAITRSLRRTTIAPSCLQASPRIQCRLESTNKSPAEQGSSFKGQLYESTAARLQREREERERFSRERDEGSGGRNAALTFGTLSIN